MVASQQKRFSVKILTQHFQGYLPSDLSTLMNTLFESLIIVVQNRGLKNDNAVINIKNNGNPFLGGVACHIQHCFHEQNPIYLVQFHM